MFRLPGEPSPRADIHELADFAEWQCWSEGSTSARKIAAYLGRIDDNEFNEGCDDDDDENADLLDEVMNEIERRETACGSGYPFSLEEPGTVLRLRDSWAEDTQSIAYLYLLLATRLNMGDNRVHADVDGTALLEELSAHALETYLGGSDRAKAFVFGTSNPGGFQDKVNELCRRLNEGSGFRSLDDRPVQAADAKLDVVGWTPFVDRQPGQLIVFGQCKTGTSWRDQTTQLQPISFIKDWIRDPFLVDPIRAFCVAEAPDRSRWNSTSVSGGILFDRCRLVEHSVGLGLTEETKDTLERIRAWTLAAKESLDSSVH